MKLTADDHRKSLAGHIARRLPWAVASALVVFGAGGCRKPAPDENVFTGQDRRGFGAGTGGFDTGSGGSLPEPSGGEAGVAESTGGAGGAGGAGEGGAPPGIEDVCEPVPEATGSFSKRKLLEAAADCAVRHYCEFEIEAVALAEATERHGVEGTNDSLSAARDAWLDAIAAWQRAEVFRFGPAGSSEDDPGGRELRAPIYFWPLVSRCRIEEQLVDEIYARPTFASSSFNGRSLGALEYLLFHEGSDNACRSHSDINEDGTWEALGADGRAERKAAYAAVLGADVLAGVRALRDAWDPDAGDFRADFVNASGGEVYSSEQQALNAVNVGLFYVEKELKDLKLGRVLGLLPECFDPPCAQFVESPYAMVSARHMANNLVGFRRLFQGCGETNAGWGFDDWLMEVGVSDLRDRMLDALSGAEAAIDRLDGSFERALTSDVEAALAIHQELKQLTDLLKARFVSVLNLEPPMGSETDDD